MWYKTFFFKENNIFHISLLLKYLIIGQILSVGMHKGMCVVWVIEIDRLFNEVSASK